LKHAKGDQPCKGTCNLTRGIEDAQSSRKFVPLIESCQIKNDSRVKSRFRHPKEPSGRHNPAKVLGAGTNHCHGAEYYHSNWKYELRSEFLGKQIHGRSCEDKWDVEDGEENVVLVAFEMKVFGHAVCFGVSKIGLVNGAKVYRQGAGLKWMGNNSLK
jgi:hypothetical protein